jgi:hypothetical protein
MRDMLWSGQVTGDTRIYCADPGYAERGWIRVADSELSLQSKPYMNEKKNKEEENTDDVKKTIKLKIIKVIRESDSGMIAMAALFGLAGLMGMLSWLATEHWNFLMLLIVLIIAAIITAIVLRHRHLKRQQDIDILNANVGKMGGDEAARRAEKYQNK